MGRELRRTWIIEPREDEDGLLQADRHRLGELLSDLEGTLHAFGGKMQVVADRVRIGTVPKDGAEPEFPLGETVGYIVEYDESVQLRDESLTLRIAAAADAELRRDAPAPEPVSADSPGVREPEDALDVDEHSPEPVTA